MTRPAARVRLYEQLIRHGPEATCDWAWDGLMSSGPAGQPVVDAFVVEDGVEYRVVLFMSMRGIRGGGPALSPTLESLQRRWSRSSRADFEMDLETLSQISHKGELSDTPLEATLAALIRSRDPRFDAFLLERGLPIGFPSEPLLTRLSTPGDPLRAEPWAMMEALSETLKLHPAALIRLALEDPELSNEVSSWLLLQLGSRPGAQGRLSDETRDREFRLARAIGFPQRPEEAGWEDLLSELAQDDAERRGVAAWLIATRPWLPGAALVAVRARLRDGSEEVRAAALTALHRQAPRAARAELLRAAEDGSSLVQRAALRGLGELRLPAPPAGGWVAPPHEDGAEARSPAPDELAALRGALAGANSSEALCAALDALDAAGASGPGDADAARSLLRVPELSVRARAARWLAGIEPEAVALGLLRPLLASGERCIALEAAARLGARAAGLRDEVLRAAEAGDTAARIAGLRALAALAPEDAEARRWAWASVTHGTFEERRVAIGGFGAAFVELGQGPRLLALWEEDAALRPDLAALAGQVCEASGGASE